MTSSDRIGTARATPSVTPTSTPRAPSPGIDDFAATLSQARGSGNKVSTNSTPPAKNASEGASEEMQSESTTSSRAPKSAKSARAPRDANEAEKSADRDETTGSVPAEVAAALTAAVPPPAALPARGVPEDVVAQAATAATSEAGRAAIAGAAAASPEVGTLVGALLGQNTAPTLTAQGEPVAQGLSRPLPDSRLVAPASELRPTLAQRVEQGADKAALAVVTDALQSAVNAADGNAASAANVPTPLTTAPLTTAPDGAANAALLQLTSAASTNEPSSLLRGAPSGAQHFLHTPVGAQGWNDELATRLTWMVDQRQNVATLRLSPENMGPLDVRIDVRENQVSVWFGAAQADTRAAIESALPRLREMLQGQGLSLTDAGVFQQSHRESPKHSSTSQGALFSEADGASEMNVALRVGLFDGYA